MGEENVGGHPSPELDANRATMPIAVEARGLSRRFGDLTAVDHVSFEVGKGEIFGFLGPNGAGKTTTINMLITLLKPDDGIARVAGYDVVGEPDQVRKRIGVVFQDPSSDRELTGYENLWVHGMIYGVPRSELATGIRRLLEFVELWDWRDVPVKRYSGGMVRRLEIARGLLHEPSILFLDEPTIGLDPQTRAKLWEYTIRIRRERGTTIFLTTHYMDEAERLCDRVAIIDHGRILALDRPSNLIKGMGGDVIYVKLVNGSSESLISRLEEKGMLLDHRPAGSTLMLRVFDAPTVMPIIFDVANGMGIKISEVSYRRPTLEDVFLYYTGRSLRDSEADWREAARMHARRGMRR